MKEIEEWLKRLVHGKAYEGIDVYREYEKMKIWCEFHRKQPTQRRFIAWLNRADRTLPAIKHTTTYGRNYLPPTNEIPEEERKKFMETARAEVAKLKEQFKMRPDRLRAEMESL